MGMHREAEMIEQQLKAKQAAAVAGAGQMTGKIKIIFKICYLFIPYLEKEQQQQQMVQEDYRLWLVLKQQL